MIEDANNLPCPIFGTRPGGFDSASIKAFQAMLREDNAGQPVSEQNAAEAYRNLGEFVSLLIKINQRVGLVNLEDPDKPFVREGERKASDFNTVLDPEQT